MSQKFGRAGRGTVPSGPKARRRWVGWAASAGGVVLAVLLCVVICLGVVHDAARLHGQQDHEHPPGPHGGTVAAVGRNRFHVEAVFERTGQVRVYTYGEDQTQVYPTDAQPVPATVRRPSDPTEFSILLSPEPQPGDPPGKSSRFVGRLPQELDDGPVELTVPAMSFGGERHWFRVKSAGERHRDPVSGKAAAGAAGGARRVREGVGRAIATVVCGPVSFAVRTVCGSGTGPGPNGTELRGGVR